jgi:hypothetical protein
MAGVRRIEIERVESAFDGARFGDVGPYEKLVGRVFGEVDPADPRNAPIADLELAPRNERGLVEYAADLIILRPVDPARGNGRLLYDVNNRGSMRALAQLQGSDPTREADPGNGFLLRRGYTIAASGWDALVPAGDGRLTLSVPQARNRDGSAVVGLSLEEFVIDGDEPLTRRLTYPAATLDRDQAQLTVRVRFADEPIAVPSSGWEYVDERSVRLLAPGSAFADGRIYQLCYPARSPRMAGLGLAAQRDVPAFLRNAAADALGNPNPLAGSVRRIIAFAISQPARFLHDFVQLGFNQDERGQRVFDGILNWLGGASGCFANFRFAQPFRTHRQRIGRSYPELAFPFAFPTTADPVTGESDGRLRRAEQTGTCPKCMEVNSANEYWAKAGSLLHTDPLGSADLADPESVRFYLLASFPHGAAPESPGICQQIRNPLRAGATLRALLVALEQWVSEGREPPPSEVPRLASGTLVPPLPQREQGFPAIPGVTYSGVFHEGDRLDFGPDFKKGILGVLPPRRVQPAPYRALVPRTDLDGNDLAGIRVLDVAVPLATYTGWALRAGPAAGDGGDGAGQKISFARTRAERVQSGDPRLSLEERYPTREAYLDRLREAARSLVERRFLLEEDAAAALRAAGETPVSGPPRR